MRRHSEVDVSKAVRKLCRWPPSERIRRDLEVAGHEVWIDMAKTRLEMTGGTASSTA